MPNAQDIAARAIGINVFPWLLDEVCIFSSRQL
jgi:hypothetical protein